MNEYDQDESQNDKAMWFSGTTLAGQYLGAMRKRIDTSLRFPRAGG